MPIPSSRTNNRISLESWRDDGKVTGNSISTCKRRTCSLVYPKRIEPPETSRIICSHRITFRLFQQAGGSWGAFALQGLARRLREVICGYCRETRKIGCCPDASCPGTLTGHLALLGYCESLWQERGRSGHRADPRIEKALTFLEENWQTQVRVADLAKRFALSQSHFRSLFGKATGVSLRQYLFSRRLREAAFLLQKTNLSVAQICFSVGWSDLSNFNRAFKRHFHLRPNDLRQSVPMLQANSEAVSAPVTASTTTDNLPAHLSR